MRAKKLFILTTILAMASCGRPNNPIQSDDSIEDNTASEQHQVSAIPTTGGRAVSADGLFAVIVSPLTFDTLVTIDIEKLSEPAAPGAAGVFGLYRVRFINESAELEDIPNTHTVRIEFTMAQEALDEIGIEDLRATYRTEQSGEAAGQLEARYLDGKVWSTSNTLLADFGLIRTDTAGLCECNEDESCTESCVCDPDCEQDSSGPTGPDGGGDTNSTVDCEEWEFSCSDQTQCIPEIYLCDGSPQCNDGSDEAESVCQGSSGGGSTAGDQYEPDNSFSEASEIGSGETQMRSLPSGDGDFVRFDLPEEQDVTVTATPQSMSAISIQVYNAEFAEVAASASGGFGMISEDGTSNVNTVLEAGTYYIYVSPASGAAGAYSLSLLTQAPLEAGPTNLTIGLEGAQVLLTWEAVENAASYNVYYGEYEGGPYESFFAIASEGTSPISTTETSQTLSGLPVYSMIYAVVRAVDADGAMTYPSNEVGMMIPLAADIYEEDNTRETAGTYQDTPLTTGSYARTHSAHTETDEDWTRFELAGPGEVRAQITSTDYADAELFLYDEAGNELSYGYFNDLNGNEPVTSVSADNLEAGTYYLMSRPNQAWSSYNNYTLTLTVTLAAPVSGPADAFENDNTIDAVRNSDSNRLRSGQPQTHSIHQNGDIDYTWFTLDVQSDIVLSTQSDSGDTVMRLYNAAGELVEVDETPQSTSTINQSDLPAGTYFVSISSQSTPQFIESYTLTLNTYIAPAAPSSLTLTPGPGIIVATWPAVSGATSYKVYYQYSDNPPFEVFEATEGSSPLSVSTTSVILSALPTEAATYICVAALNGTAEGECTETVSGTPGIIHN